MKEFEAIIYFHRAKDENMEIVRQAEEIEFENSDDLKYLGYEIEMTVAIREDGQVLIKKIGFAIHMFIYRFEN